MNGTGNNIGAEGARMISESLKINTTLAKLNLYDDIKSKKGKKERHRKKEIDRIKKESRKEQENTKI